MEAYTSATSCDLGTVAPIDGQSADVDDAGLVMGINGQLYDLGDDEGSVVLTDNSGLSTYPDLDGGDTVNHVTTVHFDDI